MNMRISWPVLICATPLAVPAGVLVSEFNGGFEAGGVVPDGEFVPWSDSRVVAGASGQGILDVSVRIEISGGYNGDLYAYLSHGGVLVPLLNRVGMGSGNTFGYGDSGMDVVLTDAALHNIHAYQAVVGYTISDGAAWQPDGRSVNPVTSLPGVFDAPGSVGLSAFSEMMGDGEWTLVVADVSAGGGNATVVRWGLEITTVPEPEAVTWVMGGILLVGGFCWRWCHPERLSIRSFHGPGRSR